MSANALRIDTNQPLGGYKIAVASPSDKIPGSPLLRKAAAKGDSNVEGRKILAVALSQLERRKKPPPIHDVFSAAGNDYDGTSFGAIVDTVRGAVNFKRPVRTEPTKTDHSRKRVEEDEDEDEEDDSKAFSTEETLDLLFQLREVLILSIAQNWRIFDDSSVEASQGQRQHESTSRSRPFRRSRHSLRPGGLRSRSTSPAADHVAPPARPLLDQCISVLSSVCLEDCRFKVTPPRPSRPPYSLQAVFLDIIGYLLYTLRHDQKLVCELALAVTSAFSSFPPLLHGRLLAFFDSVMRPILSDLDHFRNETVESRMPIQESENINEFSVSIQVEDVGGGASIRPLFTPWTSLASGVCIKSVLAPDQSLSLYYLSCVVRPLLTSMLDSLDMGSNSMASSDTLYRFHRLFRLMKMAKSDLYSDLLEVIAFGTKRARQNAISLLMIFWPKAAGHITVSKPWPNAIPYSDHQERTHPHDHFDPHEFVLWNFLDDTRCRACTNTFRGLGLFCAFCFCAVHYGCYDLPNGRTLFQYSEGQVDKLVSMNYSFIAPFDYHSSFHLKVRDHDFHLANLFTLSLCSICRDPLWGTSRQGMKCRECWLIGHPECLSARALENFPCHRDRPSPVSPALDYESLRQSCLNFYPFLRNHIDVLKTCSFEELCVLQGVLWTQLQIITNGINSGSVDVLLSDGKTGAQAKDYQITPFELHHQLDFCAEALSSAAVSPNMIEYLEENKQDKSFNFFFSWPALSFVASIVKSPFNHTLDNTGKSSNLLQVADNPPIPSSQSNAVPYDSSPVSQIRDCMGHELQMFDDNIASCLIHQLFLLGFITTSARYEWSALAQHALDKDIPCSFGLPLGLDVSTDVEVLVSAVETCLESFHLSVNEFAFLILLRRFPPDRMVTEYAIKRMMRAVLHWIISEDDALATVLTDVANLPGVRAKSEVASWPGLSSHRNAGNYSTSSGGDYVAARRALLSNFAVAWLSGYHSQDPSRYALLLYDISSEGLNRQNPSATEIDQILQRVIKLAQSSAVFDVFDVLLTSWLNEVACYSLHNKSMSSLYRLYPREMDAAQRWSTVSEVNGILKDSVGSMITDPWSILSRDTGHLDGLAFRLRCVCIFAYSGVDVPTQVYEELQLLLLQSHFKLENTTLYLQGLLAAVWLRPKSRNQLQSLVTQILHYHQSQIIENLTRRIDLQSTVEFVRRSLAICLLAYGCSREKLLTLGLVSHELIDEIPSRRRLNARASELEDPIIVDAQLLSVLNSFVSVDIDAMSSLIAKFLNLFLVNSLLLEAHEMDNLILQNTVVLSNCAWRFYGLREDITEVRTTFLLRLLSVDPQPFYQLIGELINSSNWEVRVEPIERIFRIILDVNNPGFNLPDRQWHANVLPLFQYFFEALWRDDKEEIRLGTEIAAGTLLPAHLSAISNYWDLAFMKIPPRDRLSLVSFLTQLHTHFPSWSMLSWQTFFDGFSDNSISNLDAKHDTKTRDDTIIDLQIAMLSLTLMMLANGVQASPTTVINVKFQLLLTLGFENVSIRNSSRGYEIKFGELKSVPYFAQPLFSDLLFLLDSAQICSEAVVSDSPSLLISTFFVDVVLAVVASIKDFSELPFTICKSLLEALEIVILKQDFDKQLKQMQANLRRALVRTVDFISESSNFELRQVALSAIEAFTQSNVSLHLGGVISQALDAAVRLIMSESHHGQDTLSVQARSFTEKTLKNFSIHGVFFNAMKKPQEQGFFGVIVSSTTDPLREALLRDMLSRFSETDVRSTVTIVENIRKFVERVYHQRYSRELLSVVASQLVLVSRRLYDSPMDSVECEAFLVIFSILIQHNKVNCRDMITQLDPLLKVLLIRQHVKAEELSRLLHVMSTYSRRVASEDSKSLSEQHIISPIREVLLNGLRCKVRMNPDTLLGMIKTLLTSEAAFGMVDAPFLSSMVDPAFTFLQNHRWMDQGEADLQVSVEIAKFLLDHSKHDPVVVARLNDLDRSKPTLSLRTWNILIFTAVTGRVDRWTNTLISHFGAFSVVYHAVVRQHSLQNGVSSSETGANDVNHAYIAILVWLVFAKQKGQREDEESTLAQAVYNELWPPFQRLVEMSERDMRGGNPSPLALITLTSCVDLLTFVHQLQSPVAIQAPLHIDILNRIKGVGGTLAAKAGRAVEGISEATRKMDWEGMVGQIGKDMVAAEKLQLVEMAAGHGTRQPTLIDDGR